MADISHIKIDDTILDIKDRKSRDLLNKKIYFFNDINSMKLSTDIINGMLIKTKGYYNENDGGDGFYFVRNKTNEDIEDNAFIIFLQNNLVAELLIENNCVNFKQIGAKSYDENFNKIDSSQFLQKYLNKLNTSITSIKLFIPAGVYFFTSTIIDIDNIDIEGEKQFSLYNMKGSVIAPFSNEQNYIWQIGNTNKTTSNIKIKNLFFTGYNITHTSNKFYNTDIEDIYNITSLLKITKCFGGFTDNLMFMFFKGKALELTSSFEIYFKTLNFRHGQNINGSILNFANKIGGNDNISACIFESMMFEAMHGDLINVEQNANFGHNYIGYINFEDYAFVYGESDQGQYTSLSSPSSIYNDSTAHHHAIINVEYGAQFNCDINTIGLNNFAFRYYLLNNTQYIYDTIIKCSYSQYLDINLNNLNIVGILKNARLILQTGENMGLLSSVIVNNAVTDNNDCKFYCDVSAFTNLIVNNITDKTFGKTKLIYNKFRDYRTNAQQYVNGKQRGNVKHDDNSINDDKLVLNLINPVTYPSVNRMECIIPVLGKKLHLRAKLPSAEGTISLGTEVINTKTSSAVTTKNINAQGTGNFEWYTLDYSSNITDEIIGDCIVRFFPNNGYDFNIELDCFFWE